MKAITTSVLALSLLAVGSAQAFELTSKDISRFTLPCLLLG